MCALNHVCYLKTNLILGVFLIRPVPQSRALGLTSNGRFFFLTLYANGMGAQNIVRSMPFYNRVPGPNNEDHAEEGMLVFEITQIIGQNFDDSHRWRHDLGTWSRDLGWNLLLEYMPIMAEVANYDISALLAADRFNDDQDLHNWRCAICNEGIDEGIDGGRKLIAAHEPRQHCYHVFHLQCLLGWRAYSDTCPTCRQEIFSTPLPNEWSASMKVNARMGANLYTVQWF